MDFFNIDDCLKTNIVLRVPYWIIIASKLQLFRGGRNGTLPI